MALISSQSPDNPMFANSSELADRVYPGDDYPALVSLPTKPENPVSR